MGGISLSFSQHYSKNKIAHLAIFVVAAYPDNAEPNFFSFVIVYRYIVSKISIVNFFCKKTCSISAFELVELQSGEKEESGTEFVHLAK